MAETKERIKAVDEVLQDLVNWKEYVTTLNECAYSDGMLRVAIKKLTKIYDNEQDEPLKDKKKEKLYKSMILKYFDDDDFSVKFKEVGNEVVMITKEINSNDDPDIVEYDSYREVFDVWSQSIIEAYSDHLEFEEEDDDFYDFTKEEKKLLEEYINED